MRPSAICRTMTLSFSGSSQMCGLPDADEQAATVWSRMRPTPWDVVMTRSWGFAAFLTSPLTQTSSPNPTSSSRWACPRLLRSLGLGEYECSVSSPVMRLWTCTCSRPTCSANSLRIGKVATILTEAAWPVGGWTSGTASASASVMTRGCNMGGTVTPSLFNVNERGRETADNPTGIPVESSIFTEWGSVVEKVSLRQPGAILLVSCYELGHQPIGIALPMGFLEQAGYAPVSLDIAVEQVDPERITHARFVGISVPMHTALRLGVRVAEQIRETNPSSHICFYGLYAALNAEYLLSHVADSVIGGEYEAPLVQLIEALERGDSVENVEGVSLRGKIVGPHLKRLPFAVPRRQGLPALERYAHLEHDGEKHVVGYVEASRGCLHHCLHCPIVPVYDGRFFIVPAEVVLEDIRRQVRAGATHITFGDPDFLNGP